ncbi:MULTISPECIES: 1-phosphofructokinase family hexose kinase [unclassified Meiothermus]|uniref:1-phosphofructokinase family hexose kinase n=1 Tax=unclassified Meiothermus TaxID=370471 RepID=UPI000D7C44B1|nr:MULTISPECIES: 1-phosphofructokinase family hexose kinase [unclassified Meiothermus]PZA06006.1 1-phosphofructokinase family hexose kinase [Meiothermus sp. Pnk-1]RYM35245.1 1-phosphofructokinase family hexose kinase [Meiothermus sp. PNK-Is4]
MSPPKVVTLTLNPALDLKMVVQAPRLGALNRAQAMEVEPSGKGINVARALARQGIPVRAVAPLGGGFGLAIERSLQATPNLELASVKIAGATRGNFKATDVETGEVTEFNAPGPTLREEERIRVEAAVLDQLEAGDLVVLSGSLPGGVGPEVYADLARRLQALGAKVLLDTGGEALRQALPARPFLVKPNRLEAEELLGWPIGKEDALRAARHIQKLGAQHVVLSLGGEGAVFLSPREAVLAFPPRVRVRSTVGCGDALLAGVVAGILQGWPWQEVARYATALAAARAAGEGVEFPERDQTQALLGGVRLEIPDAGRP